MSNFKFKDHFSSVAARYAAHRPTYPRELVDYLAEIAPANDLALDCACGTGQLTVPLADRFKRVIGVDASASQIAHAAGHPRVEYHTQPAEATGVRAASVDLVTVAQAAHWLDLDGFYAEVRRVARPGGVLALITYGVIQMDEEIDPIIQRFYRDTLGPYWPPERRLVEERYRSLPFPFAECPAPSLTMVMSMPLADFQGHLDTWSAVRALEHAAGRGPVEAFAAELAACWGDPELRRDVRWPLSLRVGVC